MRFSGMPGVSGLGYFVPALGYFLSPASVSPGNFSITINRIPTYGCVLRAKSPIALILRVNNHGAEFTPEIFISENTIPQT